MSGGCEAGVARARPLSGGLWTLFSWLRRDEHSSSESVSSAGSDRTALSFAFLPGARSAAPPSHLPPPSPTSASYRRRVRERSLRRQRERDLTLHRKYGLYGLGFDSASLPSGARDRRAVSESPRAHVPGKRRAPPPPAPQPATLPRRRARKRPAPPPPVRSTPMNRLPQPEERPRARDDVPGCKPEKYSKRDAQSKETKEVKLRSEKSFLKQIFENKKRNSAIDTSTVKLLPNISELDKQAAEMIEKYRLKEVPASDISDGEAGKMEPSSSSRRQPEAWICTRCLKKYDSSVITCNYCLPLNKHTDSHKSSKVSDGTQTKGSLNGVLPGTSTGNIEDKERLKEMLKEMKDSLPKRPKSELIVTNRTKNTRDIDAKENYPKLVEAATLRIGSSISVDKKSDAIPSRSCAVPKPPTTPPTQQNQNITKDSTLETINSVVITQPVVLVHTKENIVPNVGKVNMEKRDLLPIKKDANKFLASSVSDKIKQPEKPTSTNDFTSNNVVFRPKYDLNTPLKISSLLNPIYIPKTTSTANTQTTQVVKQEVKHVDKEKPTSTDPQPNTEEIIRNMIVPQTQIKSTVAHTKKDGKLITEAKQKVETKVSTSNEKIQAVANNRNIEVKSNVTLVNTKEKSEEISKNVSSKVVTDNVLRNDNSREKSEEILKNVSSREKSVETSKADSSKDKYVETSRNVSSIEKFVETSKNDSSKEKPVETPSIAGPTTSNGSLIDQHARRRDLINQLERSIARGDEQAAAEAAVKLAQLKLSCSVLSFSSQIVAATPAPTTPPQTTTALLQKEEPKKTESKKVEESTQRSSQILTPKLETVPVSTKQKENDLKLNSDKLGNKQALSTKQEIPQGKQSEKLNGLILPKSASGNQTPVASSSTAKEAGTKLPTPIVATVSKTDIPKKGEKANDDEEIPILIWVEDKEATRGPVQLHVSRGAALGALRARAERSLGVPARLQRWVVGRALCSDDSAPLVALAGPALDAPFYLCFVEPDKKAPPPAQEAAADAGAVYSELVQLEKQALVPNAETFECGVCTEECPPGGGVVLRECVHMFCRACLAACAAHCDAAVPCPAPACRAALQDREVRALLPAAAYEAWLARGLAAAESGSRGAFHCRTRDCAGWAMCEPAVTRFPCPVCRRTNCVPCQAIHEGETCAQHRARQAAGAGDTDEGTRALLDALIARGEALPCPECSAVITKKWGCDWIKCSACKTEICWVTRGRRWGPAGRGDTSAGCRCGVDGKRCHSSCAYCH